VSSDDEREDTHMTARFSWSLLPFLLFGCVAAPRPDPAPEPDAGAVSAILEGLHSPDPARKALARSLLEEIGPPGAPALRRILTRRLESADPFILELVASLDTRESLLADAAQDQILLRGPRATPDLWEALLTTESLTLAYRALGILARLEGTARVGSAVEALCTWRSAPKWLDKISTFPHAAARLWDASREPTLTRRSRKLTEDVTIREFLAEIDEAKSPTIFFPPQTRRE